MYNTRLILYLMSVYIYSILGGTYFIISNLHGSLNNNNSNIVDFKSKVIFLNNNKYFIVLADTLPKSDDIRLSNYILQINYGDTIINARNISLEYGISLSKDKVALFEVISLKNKVIYPHYRFADSDIIRYGDKLYFDNLNEVIVGQRDNKCGLYFSHCFNIKNNGYQDTEYGNIVYTINNKVIGIIYKYKNKPYLMPINLLKSKIYDLMDKDSVNVSININNRNNKVLNTTINNTSNIYLANKDIIYDIKDFVHKGNNIFFIEKKTNRVVKIRFDINTPINDKVSYNNITYKFINSSIRFKNPYKIFLCHDNSLILYDKEEQKLYFMNENLGIFDEISIAFNKTNNNINVNNIDDIKVSNIFYTKNKKILIECTNYKKYLIDVSAFRGNLKTYNINLDLDKLYNDTPYTIDSIQYNKGKYYILAQDSNVIYQYDNNFRLKKYINLFGTTYASSLNIYKDNFYILDIINSNIKIYSEFGDRTFDKLELNLKNNSYNGFIRKFDILNKRLVIAYNNASYFIVKNMLNDNISYISSILFYDHKIIQPYDLNVINDQVLTLDYLGNFIQYTNFESKNIANFLDLNNFYKSFSVFLNTKNKMLFYLYHYKNSQIESFNTSNVFSDDIINMYHNRIYKSKILDNIMYAIDREHSNLLVIDLKTKLIIKRHPLFSTDGILLVPNDISINSNGDIAVLCDNNIVIFDSNIKLKKYLHIQEIYHYKNMYYNYSIQLVDNDIYISDYNSDFILKYNINSYLVKKIKFSSELSIKGIVDIDFYNGFLYFLNSLHNMIISYKPI